MRDTTTFFCNTSCEFFPCHEGVDPHEFNCLFCYCPLYALGPRCGGDFCYTERGVKDCSKCTRLHKGDAGARIVRERFAELADLAQQGQGGER
ncbi:MAG: cysteine-rich small domain-containing protein [Coriobacteriales bacterium]|nr:cysteine-rich small domain-containing protein [Coriobacteriales bacterium]